MADRIARVRRIGTMDCEKNRWDLADIVTGFAARQSLTFLYPRQIAMPRKP
jgi:hypothetical protein